MRVLKNYFSLSSWLDREPLKLLQFGDPADNLGSLTLYSVMGAGQGECSPKKTYPLGPDGKPLKPCCACPETKRIRDACIIEKGEENCAELIEAHKACMRSLGFNI